MKFFFMSPSLRNVVFFAFICIIKRSEKNTKQFFSLLTQFEVLWVENFSIQFFFKNVSKKIHLNFVP